MTIGPLSVGVIGCGNISRIYLANMKLFPHLIRLAAVADLDQTVAAEASVRHGVPALSVDALLADPEIDIVLNLTVPSAHVPVAMAAVAAGKHVYLEKPLGTQLDEATSLTRVAAARGLRIGVAPDTFLGAAHQTARRLIDEGAIGRIIGGSAAIMDRGMEDWHPNPAFFFQQGGGPVFDMGPYYLTSLIALLGPVKQVMALESVGLPERHAGSGPMRGARIPIDVATTTQALLRFENGADVSFSASWDVWAHRRDHIEIYGTEGSIILPDPNWFGGPVLLSVGGGAWRDVSGEEQDFGRQNRQLGDGSDVADYRALGLADMAAAIIDGSPHCANGELALHVLEIMQRLTDAAKQGIALTLASNCQRPLRFDPTRMIRDSMEKAESE